MSLHQPIGTIAAAARNADFMRVSTFAALLVEEQRQHRNELLNRVTRRNTLVTPATVNSATEPAPSHRVDRTRTPAQRRRERQRTLRGITLAVIATMFATATQYVELTFATSRPQAVLITTAVAAATMVVIDTWLIGAIIRRRNRNTDTACTPYRNTARQH